MEIKLIKFTNTWTIWNRDFAFDIRKEFEEEFLSSNDILKLDFENISSVTQSSMDELIWVFITNEWKDIIERFRFLNCNEKIKDVIIFVLNDRVNRLKKSQKS